MKTIFLSILMLFAFTASQAQIKGVPLDEAVPIEDVEDYTMEEIYGILTKVEGEDLILYSYLYKVKGKGYFDALKRLEYILEANDINRSPDVDDTYFPIHVNDHDYNQVARELLGETGWIEKIWYVYDDQYIIFMKGISKGITVSIIHFQSSAAREKYERFQGITRGEKISPSERELYTGRANTEVTSGSEGITEGNGNQGSLSGTPDSDNYVDGIGGRGINFSLEGRNPVSIPKPEYNVQEAGTVVVTIRVNREGIVTSAEAGASGTNTLNKELLEAAKKAALKARFNSSPDAAFTQQGTITYHFVLD